MSEEPKETMEVTQAISILAQEVKKTNDRLAQIETASRGEPVPQQQQGGQPDAFNAPLTMKSLLSELPNIINMAKQAGIMKTENPDPLANYKYAIGERALDRVFEDLNKSLFEKGERKTMNDLVHGNEAGIQ